MYSSYKKILPETDQSRHRQCSPMISVSIGNQAAAQLMSPEDTSFVIQRECNEVDEANSGPSSNTPSNTSSSPPRRPAVPVPPGAVLPPAPVIASDPERDYALACEHHLRSVIPRAGNQYSDILEDNHSAVVNAEFARDFQDTNRVSDIRRPDIFQVLGVARSAELYHGGACNEYSAGAFKYHMQHSNKPVYRYWAEGMGHSFTVAGDAREENPYVADGWTLERDPVRFNDSVMSRDQLTEQQRFLPRMGNEGPEVIERYEQRQYDQILLTQDRMDQLREQALEVYRQTMEAIAGGEMSYSEAHLYEHPSNRSQHQ